MTDPPERPGCVLLVALLAAVVVVVALVAAVALEVVRLA